MQVGHVELSDPVNSELIQKPVNAGPSVKDADRQLPVKRAKLNLILNHMEKKYAVLVNEIREQNEISFVISQPVKRKRMEARSFMVGKYSNEHMMRNFARCLNKGQLSRKNIDETIYEMQSLQAFCR